MTDESPLGQENLVPMPDTQTGAGGKRGLPGEVCVSAVPPASRGLLVREALSRLHRLALERGSTFAAEVAQDAERRLAENRFNLVVLGEFKRGKTTFINGLVGAELLPSAVVPLTSVVTLVTYGEEPGATVEFQGGQSRALALEDLPDYVTERGNPRNTKGVRLVTVRYPSSYLRDGLCIVDTPGVGSVYQHNTDTAYSFLPRADAGVFLLTSDPPISAQERAYLKDVRRQVPRLFFLLNKVDRHSAEELREALEFTRGVLREELEEEGLQIQPVSARQALEARLEGDAAALEASGLPAFERELRRFLAEDRARVAVEAATRRGLALVEELQSGLGLERRATALPLETLRSRMDAFEGKMREIQEQRQEDLLLADWATRQVLKEVVDPSLREEEALGRDRLLSQLDALVLEKRREPLGVFLAALNQWLPATLTAAAQDWRSRQEQAIQQALRSALSRFSDRAAHQRSHVSEAVGDLFDLQLPTVPTEVPLPENLGFHFQTWTMQVRVDPLLAPLLRLLPASWSRSLLASQARARLREKWPMALGHAREDLALRITRTAEEYRSALGEGLDALIGGLREALARAMGRHQEGQEAVARELARLELQAQELDRCRELLAEPTAGPSGNGHNGGDPEASVSVPRESSTHDEPE